MPLVLHLNRVFEALMVLCAVAVSGWILFMRDSVAVWLALTFSSIALACIAVATLAAVMQALPLPFVDAKLAMAAPAAASILLAVLVLGTSRPK